MEFSTIEQELYDFIKASDNGVTVKQIKETLGTIDRVTRQPVSFERGIGGRGWTFDGEGSMAVGGGTIHPVSVDNNALFEFLDTIEATL